MDWEFPHRTISRMAIIVAGPLMNLLSAIVILTVVAASSQPPVQRVGARGRWPAAEAGLVGTKSWRSTARCTSGEQVIGTITDASKPLTLGYGATSGVRRDRDAAPTLQALGASGSNPRQS
jgi:membrane-associated protease RseP (regulator of RpoE activity)